MDGFQKRTIKKRKAILDTSLALFNQFGYKNVTIVQISKQAHVSLDTIYNYFESKDNLKKELLRQIINEYCSLVEDIVNSDLTAIKKLEKIVLSKVDFSRQFSSEFLTEELHDLNDLDLFEGEEKKLFLRYVIEKVVHQGIDEHIVTSKVSYQAVVSYFEIFQYYITHNLSSILQFSNTEKRLEEILYLLLHGMENK